MPVSMTRVEPGIYRIGLSGTIQLDELLEAQALGAQLADQNGDERYVLIIDIDNSTRMPFDIRHAGKLLESNGAQRVLTVGASLHIKFLASLLGRLFGVSGVEHFSSFDKAVNRAHDLL